MSSNNNIYAISSPMPDRRSARNRQPLSRTDSHDTPNSLHHIPAAMPTSRIGNTKKRKSVHKTKPYIATDLSRLGPQLVAKRLRHRRQRDQSKAYDPSPLSNSGQSTSIPTTPGKDQLSSPSSSRTPHSSSSEAREILRLARETVQDYDLTEQGSKPSLMDVILDARPPVTRYSEDLLFDAIEFGKPQPRVPLARVEGRTNGRFSQEDIPCIGRTLDRDLGHRDRTQRRGWFREDRTNRLRFPPFSVIAGPLPVFKQ